MTMRSILKMFSACLAVCSACAYAQPQGFGGPGGMGGVPGGFNNAAPNTVAGVKSNAWDDQIVYLRGRLTNYLGKDKYEFTDLQGGTIEVELDDDMPWGHISRGQLIDIVGDVDRDLFWVTIDVKHATPVTDPNSAPGAAWGAGAAPAAAPVQQAPMQQAPAPVQQQAPVPQESSATN